jgi:TonB family protein
MHALVLLLLLGDGTRIDAPQPKPEVPPRRYLPPPPPPPAASPAKPKKETAAERKKRLAEERRIRKILKELEAKNGQSFGLIGVLRADSPGGNASIFGSGDLNGGAIGGLGGGTGSAFGGGGDLRVGTGGGGKGFGTIGVAPQPTTDREAIHRVVQAHKSTIQFCYEKELAKKPDLAGRVTTRFSIDASGAVTEASVTDSTLGDANVEGCMLRQIKSWKFPAKATTVTYPFRFETGG